MAKPKKRTKRQNFYESHKVEPIRQTIEEISPRNLTQARLLASLENNDIVFALGSAGTGKSYIAAKYASIQLLKKQFKKIVITRPTVEAGGKIGFLPGGIDEKMEPWLLPIYDVFTENGGFGKSELKKMMNDGTIEIAPIQFMRGRSFKDCIIIADEMQNSEVNQLKMLLTRIGENSQIIVTGDLSQTDRKVRAKSGLEDFLDRLEYSGIDGVDTIRFTDNDIVRHPIISKILELYD